MLPLLSSNLKERFFKEIFIWRLIRPLKKNPGPIPEPSLFGCILGIIVVQLFAKMAWYFKESMTLFIWSRFSLTAAAKQPIARLTHLNVWPCEWCSYGHKSCLFCTRHTAYPCVQKIPVWSHHSITFFLELHRPFIWHFYFACLRVVFANVSAHEVNVCLVFFLYSALKCVLVLSSGQSLAVILVSHLLWSNILFPLMKLCSFFHALEGLLKLVTNNAANFVSRNF